jgi:hypothetical protein
MEWDARAATHEEVQMGISAQITGYILVSMVNSNSTDMWMGLSSASTAGPLVQQGLQTLELVVR